MMGSRWIAWLLMAFLGQCLLAPERSPAQEASPFEKLAGRWVGEGRLGVRESAAETVRCRVTYLVSEQGRQVSQTIRCATASDQLEVRSTVTHASGVLSGSWKELSRNWGGELAGRVMPYGFKVAIKGSEFSANMDIIVKDDRQVIEIQFIDSSLIGLTLVLRKG
jgi:hypothetical protein